MSSFDEKYRGSVGSTWSGDFCIEKHMEDNKYECELDKLKTIIIRSTEQLLSLEEKTKELEKRVTEIENKQIYYNKQQYTIICKYCTFSGCKYSEENLDSRGKNFIHKNMNEELYKYIAENKLKNAQRLITCVKKNCELSGYSNETIYVNEKIDVVIDHKECSN